MGSNGIEKLAGFLRSAQPKLGNRKRPWEVKTDGVIMATSPSKCRLVYKNLVPAQYAQYAWRCGKDILLTSWWNYCLVSIAPLAWTITLDKEDIVKTIKEHMPVNYTRINVIAMSRWWEFGNKCGSIREGCMGGRKKHIYNQQVTGTLSSTLCDIC